MSSENDDLVFLANVMRERRRRQLSMHVMLHINIPPLMVGDSAFPLRTWLMKPFTNAVLTAQQQYFNYRLSRARMVSEGAYGQLKGRWRVLLRKSESSRDVVRMMTLACMVLITYA